MEPRRLLEGKKVLVTGHSGFKGRWLCSLLQYHGAFVHGVALEKIKGWKIEESLFTEEIADIRERERVASIIERTRPDFLIHLAAQALVKESYVKPVETWSTNVMGTINVLEGIKKADRKITAVFVTSDKCYENREWAWGYRETDQLGGVDPYSSSKAGAEIAISSYARSFFVENEIRIASARAGNVIGGGDWSEGRIVPDCIKAWEEGEKVVLRNKDSTRPWQHVLEPLRGYISLMTSLEENKAIHGQAYNFGPSSDTEKTVAELVGGLAKYWKDAQWEASTTTSIGHEARLLRLSCEKVKCDIGWLPRLDFEQTLRMTAEWYRANSMQQQIGEFTISQIEEYCDSVREEGRSL